MKNKLGPMVQMRASLACGALLITALSTAYAAGGSKKTSEECKDDGECYRGHCHTKKDGGKVCVDCSASEVSNFRGQIERYCKVEPRGCQDLPKSEEAAEIYFTVRIENGERCIAARKEENSRCWDGSNQGHRDAVDLAESTRRICHDQLNTRKGNGGIYTCSDSTYASQSRDAEDACGAYGKGCDEWSKDSQVVSCRDIEDAMKKADKCVVAVERLDSDCLPRLSSRREAQFGRAKKAYDSCKDVFTYKTSNKLCK
jgi:hypothetical protein